MSDIVLEQNTDDYVDGFHVHGTVGTHDVNIVGYQSRIDGRLVLDIILPYEDCVRVFVQEITVYDGGDPIDE